MDLPSPDPSSRTYTISVLAFNTSSGGYDVVHRQMGLSETDFPYEIPGGLPSGVHYEIAIEGVVQGDARRVLNFTRSTVEPIGKMMAMM